MNVEQFAYLPAETSHVATFLPSRAHTSEELSHRLVLLVRPLRLLAAIRWPVEVENRFLAEGCQQLPRLDDIYAHRPLGFDPETQRAALLDLERDIRSRLGHQNPLGQLLLSRCRQAVILVHLLEARGTARFAPLARTLFGSNPRAVQAGADILRRQTDLPSGKSPRVLSAHAAGLELSRRLTTYFAAARPIGFRLADNLEARASAGGDGLKVRREACFNNEDIRLLEVHEGWIHLGTTRNAREQTTCRFLGCLFPEGIITQEGLAVWSELVHGVGNLERSHQLLQRAQVINMAEAGADFLDIFRFHVGAGAEPRDAFRQTARVFRGSLLKGAGPFPKDLAYLEGLALVSETLKERPDALPLLLCGKTTLGDLPALEELRAQGKLVPPRFVPEGRMVFADRGAVT
ncbi:MAG: DUF1704 domain-containing protein [Gemmataceae bacterium]